MRRTFVLLALSLFALFALPLADAQAAEKQDVLIVTGFDVKSHVWEESTKLVQGILEDSGKFNVTVSTSKEDFTKLDGYDAVILNYGFWEEPDPSDDAKQGLLSYVKNGGNVVALHFASSSFQGWDEYHELLGRWWKKGLGGHGPYGEFTVNIKDNSHPITKGISDFKTEDELYAKLSGEGQIQVLATAKSDWSGSVEPIVWVKQYGEGRVVHNVLGHGLDAKRNPSYQKLLIRSVQWAATGEVSN